MAKSDIAALQPNVSDGGIATIESRASRQLIRRAFRIALRSL